MRDIESRRDMATILIRLEPVRKLGVVLACAALLAADLRASHALGQDDAGGLRAAMTCDHVDTPGRVRCEVEARAPEGESIAWGDVVIVKTPPFAGALRGRIGPHDATARDAGVWRWALALVAREKGIGDVEGRVRLVVCKDGKCGPREVVVTGKLVVGE
jgi:hypothetical protein